MQDAEVKQAVFDLLIEQPTLGIATDAEFVKLIFGKFGKKATAEQVAAQRAALKTLANKAAVEAIPRPEANFN